MRKFQCLLFVLQRSYICYDIICMTVPLKIKFHRYSPNTTKYPYKLKYPCRSKNWNKKLKKWIQKFKKTGKINCPRWKLTTENSVFLINIHEKHFEGKTGVIFLETDQSPGHCHLLRIYRNWRYVCFFMILLY